MSALCEVCQSNGPFNTLVAEEKMFGLGGHFIYLHCQNCETLFLKDVPIDMGSFYPSYYYSFASSSTKPSLLNRLKQSLWDARFKARKPYAFWAKALLRRFPNAGMEAVIKMGPRKSWDILDLGCGAGDLVRAMRKSGFSAAMGADAFVEADIYWNGQLLVKKAQADEISGQYDLIMLHHAFEHMPHPEAQLKVLHSLLKPQGKLLLRFPTVTSEAFNTFQKNWVQLDAPRHLFLHSEKGMRLMAEHQGFEVLDFYTDAIAFQFWGSEWYARGGALFDAQTGKSLEVKNQFSRQEMLLFQQKTRELNAMNQGDQAVWVLQKRKSN